LNFFDGFFEKSSDIKCENLSSGSRVFLCALIDMTKLQSFFAIRGAHLDDRAS